ncbi:glycosyltransferase [archaeon]|jgi:glycosyltransferase involved in cell wall biosynthesis|nr:glycosyltransferase [archaeon]MBT4418190.1 glycosyltransferase [archaeon]
MKILFIQDRYIKGGGTEKFIEIRRRKLEEKGHQTFLFTISPDKLNFKNSIIININEINPLNYYFKLPEVYLKLRKYIKKINPDEVHIQNHFIYLTPFLSLTKNYKRKIYIHHLKLICPSAWGIYRDTKKICDCNSGIKCLKHKCVSKKGFLDFIIKKLFITKYKKTEEFIANSKSCRDLFKKQNFKNIKYKKLPFEPEYRDKKIKRQKNLFIYYGGFHSHKGIYLLINAFKIAIKENPNIKLEILGEGREKDNVKKLIKKYRLKNNISLIGNINRKELYKYYKKATATIIPSIWFETWGYVVTESLFFNTPVIGSDMGGIKEQLENNKLGVLFKRNDSEDLAKKILKLSDKTTYKSQHFQ